jgi:hypothetical protein
VALPPLGLTTEAPIMMEGDVIEQWKFAVFGSGIIQSLAVGVLCPFTLTPKCESPAGKAGLLVLDSERIIPA